MAIDGTRIFVLGGKGGIGKDVVAEGLFIGAQMAGLDALLIEIEAARRLQLLYPEAVSILYDAPSPEVLYANPDHVFEAFDEALKHWRSAQLSISCFGANITPALIVWARANGAALLGEGDGLILAVVLTMNRHALSGGLTELYDLGAVFPRARRVAVLNDVHAPFIVGDQHLARRLEEARGIGSPIETVRVARCAAPTWGYLQNVGSLSQIVATEPQTLIDLGLPEGPVYRSKAIVATWVADGLIAPLAGLLPKAPKPRKAGA